jgi:hypothetical protein
MAIDQNGVFIPDDFETIRDTIQANQNLMGTNMEIFPSTVYQSMSNPIITGIFNLQSLLASLPSAVSNELTMQNVYISQAEVGISTAITNKAKESEFIEYAEIFNKSDPIVAQIELYIYKDDITYDDVDLQYTADAIALLTPPFVPYFANANVALSKTYTSPVSSVSTIDIIFNIADAVPITIDIVTNPILGTESEKLKVDFSNLFNTTQTIGKSFDAPFYQRTLFISGLSSMDYTADVTDCLYYQILRIAGVTVNGV